MRDINISVDGIVKSKTRATTCKRRVVVGNHQCLRIDSEDSAFLSDQERIDLINRIEKFLTPESIVLISDYAKGVIDEELIAYIVSEAKKKNALVLADPKGPCFRKYKNVHFLKPNLKEFDQIVHFLQLPRDGSIVDNGREICRLLEIKGLIITLGDKGIHFISEKENILSPSFKREVYDLSGAGDTVIAFLALAFVNKLDIRDALRLANNAASVAVSHLKTYPVNLNELISKEIEPSEKIFHDWARLKIELDWMRVGGRKVVFVNGCFDLLHSGHVYLLTEAKKLGEILVLALNTDNSVKKLNKGLDRPINGIKERSNIMAALGAIDFVTSFSQDTPDALIRYIRPDVLVKGGDYERRRVIGFDFVTSYGGDVKIIDLVQGRSTTKIIKKVRQVNNQ